MSYPQRQMIEEYGELEFFESKEGVVNLYYTKDNLLPDIDFEIEVKSGDFSESFNITPRYSSMEEIPERMIWTKTNMSYIIALVLLLVFGGIGYALYKISRR